MIVIDQRVCLETMFLAAGRHPGTDAMDAFRAEVLAVLGPFGGADDASITALSRDITGGARVPLGPSRARLDELTTIVAAEARPWQDVTGTSRG